MRRPAVTTDAPPPQPTGTPVREEPDEQAPTPAEMDQRVHDARK